MNSFHFLNASLSFCSNSETMRSSMQITIFVVQLQEVKKIDGTQVFCCEKSSLPVWAIVMIVIMVLVVLVLIGCAVYHIYKNQKIKKSEQQQPFIGQGGVWR
ncbi:Hypothetical_protein [Hexamita inflata]|uniref:Hypothetical_protein n=1 Tax=Hexamita inflata TaxID=28002 RepID=A0AA86Q752_9EUKA|nr:Hypothetical protein HINF_LOCUS41195 [Hexamita inflata]